MHISVEGFSTTDYISESAAFSLELTRLTARESIQQITLEAQLILEHVMDVDIVMEASPNEKKANSKVQKVGSTVSKVGKGTKAVGSAAGTTVKTGAKVAASPVVAGSTANKATKGAVQKGKNAVEKVKSFFKKIIEFVKNMFVRFKDNMQNLFQNSVKWLLDREKEFGDIDYTDLSTDLVPYWDGKEVGAVTMVTRNLRTSGIGAGKQIAAAKSKDGEGVTTLEGFQKTYMGDYFHDGDLKEGLLNFYRVGNVAGKDRVSIKGDNIYDRITKTIIPYIKNFEKNMNEVQKEVNFVDNTLTRIMNGMNERNIVAESYSELFREDMRNTEFAHHDEFLDIIGENTKVRDSSDSNRTKAGVNTAIRDNRTTSEKEDDKSKERIDDQVSQGSEKQVKVLYNYASTQQLALSCYITSMDERYTAYINLLKSIWKAGNVRGGRDPGKTKRQKEETGNKN